MKKEISKFDMDSIFTLLWVTLIPLVLATMILGKLLTTVLLGFIVWMYFNRKDKAPVGTVTVKGDSK